MTATGLGATEGLGAAVARVFAGEGFRDGLTAWVGSFAGVGDGLAMTVATGLGEGREAAEVGLLVGLEPQAVSVNSAVEARVRP